MSISAGDKAPIFTLKNQDGEDVTVGGKQGNNTVLLFFPLAFSSVCTAELCTTRDQLSEFNALDADVYGISVDSFFTLKEFKVKNKLNFPLLSDFNKEVSAKYDSLYDSFFDMKGVSKRSAFVIDKQGTIKYAEILDDAGKQPNFEAIKSTLKELS